MTVTRAVVALLVGKDKSKLSGDKVYKNLCEAYGSDKLQSALNKMTKVDDRNGVQYIMWK
jgi:hypothetical protein